MNTAQTSNLSEPLDRMGHALSAALTQGSVPLSHSVSERLRVARQQALAARKTEIVARSSAWAQGSALVLSGPSGKGRGFWRGLGSALPLMALVVGLVLTQWHDGEKTVSELAEIDSALLLDDLPPAAYSDAGFIQFLKQKPTVVPSSTPD